MCMCRTCSLSSVKNRPPDSNESQMNLRRVVVVIIVLCRLQATLVCMLSERKSVCVKV